MAAGAPLVTRNLDRIGAWLGTGRKIKLPFADGAAGNREGSRSGGEAAG